jgi:autotransporter strand-loop-strand O-heptosyltransferase
MITPGSVVENCYATYSIGCFDNQPDMNPENWRTVPLQKVAADQLGIEYKPLLTRLKYELHVPAKDDKPYICFSEYSTMQNKLWNNPGAWQKVIDYLVGLGYDCVGISAEETKLSGVVSHCGQSIEQTLTDLSGAQFYVGLNAGPSWLATMMGLPVIMITGVSEEWNDYPNPYRVASSVCLPGCFNDPTLPIDRGWNWCPRKKDFECTKAITPENVIDMITTLRREKGYAAKTRKVKRSGKLKHKRNDGGRSSTETSCSGSTQ